MTIHLISGGTGFLGSALVLELADRYPDDELWLLAAPPGVNVRPPAREYVFDRLAAAAAVYDREYLMPHLRKPGRVSVFECDLLLAARHLPTLRTAPDVVWHTAGFRPGSESSDLDMVGAMTNYVSRTRTARLVVVSSLAALPAGFGETMPALHDGPAGRHAEGKRHGEVIAAQAPGVSSVVVRAGTLFGYSRTGAWPVEKPPAWWPPLYDLIGLAHTDPQCQSPALDESGHVYGLPVDVAARLLVTIGLTMKPHAFYNLAPASPLPVPALAKLLLPAVGPGRLAEAVAAFHPSPVAYPRAHTYAATGDQHEPTISRGFQTLAGLANASLQWAIAHAHRGSPRRG